MPRIVFLGTRQSAQAPSPAEMRTPILPPSCRFYPSCSDYAAGSVERFGAARGLVLSLERVLRCHPLHPGGLDPVPEAR